MRYLHLKCGKSNFAKKTQETVITIFSYQVTYSYNRNALVNSKMVSSTSELMP